MATAEHDLHVDATGAVRVGSAAAATRMQAHAGTYRLVESPPGCLVFRAAEEGTPGAVLLGEATDRTMLLELLQLVASAEWCGELTVALGSARRAVVFERGAVVAATSNVPAERLGEVMYRRGRISRAELDAVLEGLVAPMRLGEALVARGVLRPNDVFAMLEEQAGEIFFTLVREGRGTFVFRRGVDAGEANVRLNLPVARLLMEGVQRIDEWEYFRRRIPDATVVPERVPGALAPLDVGARAFLQAIDGERTLEAIARALGIGEFDATKALFSLLQSGAAVLRARSASTEALVALVAQLNELLRDIHATVDGAGVGTEARATLAMFRCGGGAFDALFEGAGPADDGGFDAERMVANLAGHARADRIRSLRQALYDYVTFALFAAGSVLRREDNQVLARRVHEGLGRI